MLSYALDHSGGRKISTNIEIEHTDLLSFTHDP